MRWTLLALLPAAAAAQEEPRPLSFAAGTDRYEVPADGFESLDYVEREGLRLCMTEPVEARVAAFTEAHLGEVVTVAIGETEVIRVEMVSPYEGGCIAWPIHPMVAANYVSMLTGEPPRLALPPVAVGE